MDGGWRGVGGPYVAGGTGNGAGGGLDTGRLNPGTVLPVEPGQAGRGGQVPSTAEPLAGYGGCGGPGPAALYGIGG